MKKVTYRILDCSQEIKYFWIIKETVFLGFIKFTRAIGDYKIYNGYGEIEYLPFFSKKSAKQKLKEIKK